MAVKLTDAQMKMLALHAGTSRERPRRSKWGQHTTADERREIHFPSNPTAMSLHARGLLNWRGYDGETSGGWFITECGEGILDGSLQPLT